MNIGAGPGPIPRERRACSRLRLSTWTVCNSPRARASTGPILCSKRRTGPCQYYQCSRHERAPRADPPALRNLRVVVEPILQERRTESSLRLEIPQEGRVNMFAFSTFLVNPLFFSHFLQVFNPFNQRFFCRTPIRMIGVLVSTFW